MTENSRELLIIAANLASEGKKVEKARNKLKKLVDKGVPYDSEEMLNALAEYLRLDRDWKALEAEYLRLRGKITNS